MSFSVTPSLKVPFFVLIYPILKKNICVPLCQVYGKKFLVRVPTSFSTPIIEMDFALPTSLSTSGDQVYGKHRDVTKENINNQRQSLDGSGALWNNFSKKEPRERPTLGILLIK